MNYEEKIEYAEPVVIEKRLMQQLIDPNTDIRPHGYKPGIYY